HARNTSSRRDTTHRHLERRSGTSICSRGNGAMSRPRVLLADDHRMLTDALKRVLEPRCEVVGTVRDGRELVEAAVNLNPDIVVLDIVMPRLNGFDAARQLKAM